MMNSTTSKPVLSVRDLCIGFATDTETLRAVDSVSFDLLPGQTFALLGESGCGKSATAQALMRLLPAAGRYAGGQVLLGDDQNILTLSDAEMRQVRGRKIAMIFQEPATSLNPVLTVGDQIGEVLAIHRNLRADAARAESLSLLQQVGISDPERRLAEYPFQFSGGMKQRVMIAIALAGQPDILIADEPTTALDVTVQAQILALLKQLQHQQGMAILLITHDLGVLSQMADQIGVMYAGELVEIADRNTFFANPQHPYSRALFAAMPEAVQRNERLLSLPGQVPALNAMPVGCRFADRCLHAIQRCRETPPQWQELAFKQPLVEQKARCWLVPLAANPQATTQRPPTTPSSQKEPHSPAPVLDVNELRVHFPIRRGFFQRTVGYVKAVDGVSLQLKPGRTLALVGESGCGKTSVGKALIQLTTPTAGSVCVSGTEWVGLRQTALRPLRQQMQMVFQDPFASLNPRLRIGEILLEGLQAQGISKTLDAARPLLSSLLQQVGLNQESLDRFPHEFSGGQRQRIAIARALAVQPKVIICDEPTSALDVSVQAQILNLLRELQQSLGVAYLFITHNFGVVNYLADEIAVMYLGRIVETGSADQVLESPQHPYTQALLSSVPHIDISSSKAAEQGSPAIYLAGELPSPAAPPTGCHFHPRCPHVLPICHELYPALNPTPCLPPDSGNTHHVACHLLSNLCHVGSINA